jgi:hypothetical protein
MKYLMLIYGADDAWTEAEREECMQKSGQLCQELNAKGQYIHSSPLEIGAVTTCVRVRQSKRLITDGPFVETHEQVCGYYVIEAKNLDEAIDIAGRIPAAEVGTVEIRPIVERPQISTLNKGTF